jgi:DNA-binding transcriptional MerR regulator
VSYLEVARIWERRTAVAGMTLSEIKKLVNRYIGETNGDLHDFTHRTLTDFFPEYCELEIDATSYTGSKRVRFEAILQDAEPEEQAKIIRGVLVFCPLSERAVETRTKELRHELKAVAERLAGNHVNSPEPKVTSAVVERAIRDAATLIEKNG